MSPNADPVHAVLWLRTLAPYGVGEIQAEVVDRLERLEADGRIDDLDVDVWGKSTELVRTADRDSGDVRETVAEFERWASENDRTLRPAFGRHGVDADGDGRVVLPLLCLAVYEAKTVRAVYPHVDGEDVYTIHGIEALESRSPKEGSSADRENEGAAPLRP
jgi:hypothetical protein